MARARYPGVPSLRCAGTSGPNMGNCFIISNGPSQRPAFSELFEKFVAEWLRQNLPPTHRLRAQSQVILDEKTDLKFIIDLTVEDSRSGTVLYVLDTNYKRPHTPSNDDIAHVTAYAASKGCRDAILIYPSGATESIDCHVGEIRVRPTNLWPIC